LASFPPLVLLMLRAPRSAEAPVERAERPSRLPLRILAALAGVLIGAELLVFGTGRVVDELGLSETVFGLLVIGAAVSFEEIVLEALPAFRGYPELSVGNALGTLVFLLTGSLGVIVLARPIDVPQSVVDYHLPALGITVLISGALLARGRLGRPEGTLLVATYAAYAAGALLR
jgi:cation:H+ antiporter